MRRSLVFMSAAAAAAALAAPFALAAGESKTAAATDDARYGEEVNRVCFSSEIQRWSPVEGQDGYILLDRAANDWYLFDVTDGCSEKLISRANNILIENKPGSSCLTRNDKITIQMYGGLGYTCRINQINKWNATGAAPDIGALPQPEEEAESTSGY